MISKLPGCITIIDGPEEATEADIVCNPGLQQPGVNQTVVGAKDSRDVAALLAARSVPIDNDSTSNDGNKASSATNSPSTRIQSTVASATASTVNMANGYVTAGCYKEHTKGKPVLDGSLYTDSTSMTVESCTAYCEKKGFPIAGLEDAQECFCGAINYGTITNASRCDLPCTGNTAEICGGRAVLGIYMSG